MILKISNVKIKTTRPKFIRLTLQEQSVLSFAAALNWCRFTTRLVVTHPPGIQIPKGCCVWLVAGGDEGQLRRKLRHGEQRGDGRFRD